MSPFHLLAKRATTVPSWTVKTPESKKIQLTKQDLKLETAVSPEELLQCERNRGKRIDQYLNVIGQLAFCYSLPFRQGMSEEGGRWMSRKESLYHEKTGMGGSQTTLDRYWRRQSNENDDIHQTTMWGSRGRKYPADKKYLATIIQIVTHTPNFACVHIW